jgi:hypothetical protein
MVYDLNPDHIFNLPMCKEIHLMTNLKQVVCLVNKYDGQWKADLYMLSLLAKAIDLDTAVYILPTKVYNALDYLSMTSLITLGNFLDNAVNSWVEINLHTILEIGFAPGLTTNTYRAKLIDSLKRYQEKLELKSSHIAKLLSDPSIRNIADSEQVKLMRDYAANFKTWAIIF